MQQRRDATVGRAARLLFRGAPNALMARELRRPRGTVRSWMSGHRRAPVATLKELRERCDALMREISTVAGDLGALIWEHECEPKRRRGFCDVRERDGSGSAPRDARYRAETRRS